MAFFLVIRGPLGAGKTTVARRLAQILHAQVVSVDALLEEFEWDGGSEELFLKTNRRAVESARRYLETGTPVIFDGNFYWQTVLDDLTRRLAVPGKVFSLDVPLELCLRRDRARKLSYGTVGTREVFEKVERVKTGIPIDGSGTISNTVAIICQHLPARWTKTPRVPRSGRAVRTRPVG